MQNNNELYVLVLDKMMEILESDILLENESVRKTVFLINKKF